MTIVHARPVLGRFLVRLTRGHDRHCQRWELHVPCGGEQLEAARPLLLLLALPTFGLAFAISVLTTYGPVVLIHLTNSASQVGALIGGEGTFALAIPLLAEALSDRLPGTPAARRFPFVLAGAALVVAGLALLALSGSVALAAVAVLAFCVGYYLYYPPYRALSADLLARRLYARAQSSQAVLRGAGLGVALLAGGLLLTVWRPLPLAIAAVALVATALALAPLLRLDNSCLHRVLPYETRSLRRLLLSNGQLRAFATANALGVQLQRPEELHRPLRRTRSRPLPLGCLGRDRRGRGCLHRRRAARRPARRPARNRARPPRCHPHLRHRPSHRRPPHTLTPMLVGLPFGALAGAIVMTLPQTLAFTLAPPGSEGAAAGLQDFSRGVGVVLGPIAVGATIDAFNHQFSSTHGYAAMWPVIGTRCSRRS